MRRPDRYAGPALPDRLPSWRATLTLAALPVLPFVLGAFPVATAVLAAALAGTVAGAALHRRYPDAVDRATTRLPVGDESVPTDG